MKTIGIIGLGSIGRRHLRLVKEIRPNLNVVAIRSGLGGDVDEASLVTQTVASIEEALELGIEAAIIATPADLHESQVRALSESSIPFLVEKPLTLDLDEANHLLIHLDKSRGVGLVGYNLRYNSSLQHFRNLLSANTVGETLHASIDCGSYLPDWRPGRDYRTTPSAQKKLGGGVLRELSHEIDYALWLFGPFQSIFATVKNSGTLDVDVEDIATLYLESAQGHSVTLHLDFCRRHPNRSCTVFGTHGQVSWSGISQTVELIDPSNRLIRQTFPEERDEMYRRQINHFFEMVEEEQSPLVPVAEGVEVMRLIEAAKESSRTNCRIML